MPPIRKLLVANRGEIAIRVFRAAYELDIETVAVYTWEDRSSLHRLKADEAYQIGDVGRPLQSEPYLDISAIIGAAAESGADAVHPGYGFLSENPDLASACADAGLTFVGPPPEVLRLCGNKMRAQAAAAAAGLPVLKQSSEVTADTAMEAAAAIGFPLFVKAAARPCGALGAAGRAVAGDQAKLVAIVTNGATNARGGRGPHSSFTTAAVKSAQYPAVPPGHGGSSCGA